MSKSEGSLQTRVQMAIVVIRCSLTAGLCSSHFRVPTLVHFNISNTKECGW
jgi:hypothetical protein